MILQTANLIKSRTLKVLSPGLLIFTRYPEPGQSKTRLIPALGPLNAASLQEKMGRYTINQARLLRDKASPDLEITVWYRGGSPEKISAWLGTDLIYKPQHGHDLGERIQFGLTQHFQTTSDPALVIGTDCPDLNPQILIQALDFLENHEIVIGPAVDGGYYLIGLRRMIPEIFSGISWGSDQVFRETLTVAKSLNLTVAQLPTLRDIDRPEDLAYLEETPYKSWLEL